MSRCHVALSAGILLAVVLCLGGNVLLARDNLPLSQRTWKLAAFTYQGQRQSYIPTIDITLNFRIVSLAYGINDCNSYGTTYFAFHGYVHFSFVTQQSPGDAIYCVMPATIAQESLYMTALEDVTSYTFTPTGLEFHDASDQMVLQYRAICTVPNYLDQTIC